MPVTTAYKNIMLDALPDTVYVAFFNGGAPGAGGTEVTPGTLWGSGDRPAVTLGEAASGARTPDGDAALGTVAPASQAVTHVAYYTAATAGDLIAHVPYARTLQAGDPVLISDLQNVFSLSDPA